MAGVPVWEEGQAAGTEGGREGGREEVHRCGLGIQARWEGTKEGGREGREGEDEARTKGRKLTHPPPIPFLKTCHATGGDRDTRLRNARGL